MPVEMGRNSKYQRYLGSDMYLEIILMLGEFIVSQDLYCRANKKYCQKCCQLVGNKSQHVANLANLLT